MTDKLKEPKARLLDSQLAYSPEDRPTIDELISMKKDEKSKIIQLDTKDYNQIIEQTILSHQSLEIAESNVIEIANDHVEREHKIMERGFKMLSEPFIPEYAGFKYEGTQGGHTLYSKGGKTIASTNEKWILFGIGDTPLHLELKNMYQAVATLSALGIDVTIDEVLNS